MKELNFNLNKITCIVMLEHGDVISINSDLLEIKLPFFKNLLAHDPDRIAHVSAIKENFFL